MQVDRRASRASNDTQSITNTNDELTDGSNTDAIIGIDNTNNAAIAAENVDNAATDAENTDNATIDADNTSNAAKDGKKSDDAAMSDNDTDNAITGNGNTDNTATGNGSTDYTATGETSTVDVPSPLCYGRKTKDPSKIKTSTKCMPTIVEPSIGDPLPNENAIVKASGHTFDPTDLCRYEFFILGAPNPLDLEGIEEDQLLEIQ